MASNRKQKRVQRDALTGEPLQRDTLRIVLHAYDPTRPAGRQEPIPTRMHRSRIADNGTPEWTAQFARYMRHVMPESLVLLERDYRMWWSVPGIWDHLYARYPDSYDAVDAVWWITVKGCDWQETADYYNKTVAWLNRWYSKIQHTARAMLPTPSRITKHLIV
jgi:hypothetical protein